MTQKRIKAHRIIDHICLSTVFITWIIFLAVGGILTNAGIVTSFTDYLNDYVVIADIIVYSVIIVQLLNLFIFITVDKD